MVDKTATVLKAWLTRCPPHQRAALERFLSESERSHLDSFPTVDVAEAPEGYTTGGPLDKIHWSWFIPTLKTYTPRDQRLFLSALDLHAMEQLGSALNIDKPLEPVTEMGKIYLQQTLMQSLLEEGEQILPEEFLPASPLNRLVRLSKQDLIRLINLLSLYDLCQEVRQIVETKVLKKISSFLSQEQRTALQAIAAKPPETSPLPRMGLDRNWDGTEEGLQVLLHRRGLARLGIALSGQHPDLIWTLCHHLDVGRGGSLAKLCGKEPIAGMSEVAIHQVGESINLLKG